MDCSFPRLSSLIIDNNLLKPLNLDRYPALQHLNIVGYRLTQIQERITYTLIQDELLENKKIPAITSAAFILISLIQSNIRGYSILNLSV